MHSILFTVELQILMNADHPARDLAVSFSSMAEMVEMMDMT